MNYLERYLDGEYQQVWDELVSLGAGVCQGPHYNQAWAVAEETMRRVQDNCSELISRLKTMEYKFGVYPDGSYGYYSAGSMVAPTTETYDTVDALKDIVGPLPLSLEAFWQIVGSVDFVGKKEGWPIGLDPLVVEPPEGALDWIEGGEFDPEEEQVEAALAPDDLHKDNISGGNPYSVLLPDPSADFIFQYEFHHMYFVPYLRMSILQWGGFPGLEAQEPPFEPLADLIDGLKPF
jgi:hypothetical protein